MVSGTRNTLPPETTLSWVYMIKLRRHNVFVVLRMPMSKKLPLEAVANCLHGQNLSPSLQHTTQGIELTHSIRGSNLHRW